MSSSAARTPEVVAVINSSTDITDMLRLTLEQAGFVVVTALTVEIRDGEIDLERFMSQHKPRVVVYDIAPPYESNWRLFQHVRGMPVMAQCHFIMTSTNLRHVEKLVSGNEERIYEVVGKPYDLGEIVEGVRQAMRARVVK